MIVYMVTDDSGYSCYLIGIFDTRERAKEGRKDYIAEHETQSYLDRSRDNYFKKVTHLLEAGYLKGEINAQTREILALSGEERAYWWMETQYRIREIKLNTVVDEMLYAE